MLRKDYLKKTVAPKDGIGMFLAERVCKKWNEDFVDEDTGEIISIERNEVIVDRQVEITEDIIPVILESGVKTILLHKTDSDNDYSAILTVRRAKPKSCPAQGWKVRNSRLRPRVKKQGKWPSRCFP